MKLCFLIGADGGTFLRDIIPWAMYDKGYDVRVTAIKDVTDETVWADIIWAEWCTAAAMWASNNKLEHNKLIIRLHRWEAYTEWPKLINWSNVDRLLVVPNPYTLKQLEPLRLGSKIVHFPNAVNLKRFKLTERPMGNKIAYVGALNLKKNIPFLLQCMYELLESDGQYELHIAGKFQDRVVENYFDHMVKDLDLDKNVFMSGFQDNVAGWLSDKSFIVCPSLVEGHPVAVMEGMACGCKPLIHNFPGASTFFPHYMLFNTAMRFAEMVRAKDEWTSGWYRCWVESKYPFAQQAAKIEEIFEELMGNNGTQK